MMDTNGVKVKENTVLLNIPLFYPKCKREILINVKDLIISVIKEQDA